MTRLIPTVCPPGDQTHSNRLSARDQTHSSRLSARLSSRLSSVHPVTRLIPAVCTVYTRSPDPFQPAVHWVSVTAASVTGDGWHAAPPVCHRSGVHAARARGSCISRRYDLGRPRKRRKRPMESPLAGLRRRPPHLIGPAKTVTAEQHGAVAAAATPRASLPSAARFRLQRRRRLLAAAAAVTARLFPAPVIE